MELCSLTKAPTNLNSPSMLHELSGYTLSSYFPLPLDDLMTDHGIAFQLPTSSLVIFYLGGLPKSVTAEAVIGKSRAIKKLKVTTETLNAKVDNFIQIKGLQHENAIQFRETVAAGEYVI